MDVAGLEPGTAAAGSPSPGSLSISGEVQPASRPGVGTGNASLQQHLHQAAGLAPTH